MEKSREELEMGKDGKGQSRKSGKNKRATIVELTKAALVTAVFCVLAPHTLYLPVSPVGITLGSFLLYLTAVLLGPRLGCVSIFLYLCIGLLGVPVFSGYTAGAGVLFGPTGGFLIGYLPCAAVAGLFIKGAASGRKGLLRFLLGAVTGTAVLYVCGVLWFAFVYGGGNSFGKAVTACVLPFLPFDVIKIGMAAVLYKPFRRINTETEREL